MVLSEIITLMIYAVSIVFLPEYFGMCTGPNPQRFELTLCFRLSLCDNGALCLESWLNSGRQCLSTLHFQAYTQPPPTFHFQ